MTKTVDSPPYQWVPYLWSQPTADQKYFLKIREISKKQNLNLLCPGNCLHIRCFYDTISEEQERPLAFPKLLSPMG